MGLARALLVLIALLVMVSGIGLTSNLAQAAGGDASVPIPKPPKGRGEECVADTSTIRRYHMDMLNHQRDDTVHEGIRAKRFSLKQCIDCHAVKDADQAPVGYDNEAHFCRSCHDYAAVAIDCFECHDSKPQNASGAAEAARGGIAALENYLKERAP